MRERNILERVDDRQDGLERRVIREGQTGGTGSMEKRGGFPP